jgi:hypothetical protein
MGYQLFASLQYAADDQLRGSSVACVSWGFYLLSLAGREALIKTASVFGAHVSFLKTLSPSAIE